MIFPLAEILRLEKFGQAHHLRAASSGIGNPTQSLLKILLGLWTTRHLHQSHAEFFRGQVSRPPRTNITGHARAISCQILLIFIEHLSVAPQRRASVEDYQRPSAGGSARPLAKVRNGARPRL